MEEDRDERQRRRLATVLRSTLTGTSPMDREILTNASKRVWNHMFDEGLATTSLIVKAVYYKKTATPYYALGYKEIIPYRKALRRSVCHKNC